MQDDDSIKRKVHKILSSAVSAPRAKQSYTSRLRARARAGECWRRAFAIVGVALIVQAAALLYFALHRDAAPPVKLTFDPYGTPIEAPARANTPADQARRWREFEYRPDSAAGHHPQIRLRF